MAAGDSGAVEVDDFRIRTSALAPARPPRSCDGNASAEHDRDGGVDAPGPAAGRTGALTGSDRHGSEIARDRRRDTSCDDFRSGDVRKA